MCNTAYLRSIKNSPYFLLRLRDPELPYKMLETKQNAWFDVDDYKHEMAVVARKVYERCTLYFEENK